MLENAGVNTTGLRLAYLIGLAELEGVICSGARGGKQFTCALLDLRAPAMQPFDRDQSLADLTRRYFASHGPATEKDFEWWSGLTLADVCIEWVH